MIHLFSLKSAIRCLSTFLRQSEIIVISSYIHPTIVKRKPSSLIFAFTFFIVLLCTVKSSVCCFNKFSQRSEIFSSLDNNRRVLGPLLFYEGVLPLTFSYGSRIGHFPTNSWSSSLCLGKNKVNMNFTLQYYRTQRP